MSVLRVMHVIETLEIGGAESVLADLVNLCEPRFQPYICCLEQSGPIERRLRKDAQVFVMHRQGGNDYTLPFRLARLFSEQRIDVVVSHGWGTYLESVLARKLSGAQVMVHVAHGNFPPHAPGPTSRLKRLIRRCAETLFSVGVHQFVAVSEGVKSAITSQTAIPAGKIRVVLNGVPIIAPKPEQGAMLRKTIGLREDDVVVGTVGRLAAIKNYACLLRAMAVAKRENAQIKLVLLGDGDEREALETLSEQLGLKEDVHFLGNRDDVTGWLNVFDMFVLSSLYEGVSRAILESMAASLPVIATDVGGNREVIVDGVTGLITPPSEPNNLAKAILQLAGDKASSNEMGRKGLARVKEHFSIEQTLKMHEKIWEKRC